MWVEDEWTRYKESNGRKQYLSALLLRSVLFRRRTKRIPTDRERKRLLLPHDRAEEGRNVTQGGRGSDSEKLRMKEIMTIFNQRTTSISILFPDQHHPDPLANP